MAAFRSLEMQMQKDNAKLAHDSTTSVTNDTKCKFKLVPEDLRVKLAARWIQGMFYAREIALQNGNRRPL